MKRAPLAARARSKELMLSPAWAARLLLFDSQCACAACAALRATVRCRSRGRTCKGMFC
jgi:hypothetical protein